MKNGPRECFCSAIGFWLRGTAGCVFESRVTDSARIFCLLKVIAYTLRVYLLKLSVSGVASKSIVFILPVASFYRSFLAYTITREIEFSCNFIRPGYCGISGNAFAPLLNLTLLVGLIRRRV